MSWSSHLSLQTDKTSFKISGKVKNFVAYEMSETDKRRHHFMQKEACSELLLFWAHCSVNCDVVYPVPFSVNVGVA